MPILKSKHAGNFTVIPNEVFQQEMSIDAIGLLAYFLSLPHDWVIYKTTLHTQLKMGREKVDSVFKELQEKGYVLSVKKHTESGRLEYEHIVYDKPFNNENLPHTGLPHTVEPYMATPSTVNLPLLKTNITKETLTKETDTKVVAKPPANNNVLGYKFCVKYWLEGVHPDWTFGGQQGKALKSIIAKINKLLPDTMSNSEAEIFETFKFICKNLPEWFVNKDLPVIDSKFNEIISDIKSKKNGTTKSQRGVSKYI